jgi:RNA polymerase sigma-70 factor (ECF subfamily)
LNYGGTNIPAHERKLLLLQAKLGDSEALNVLFESCRGSLYGTALRILARPPDAEDAVQEAMIAAFTQLHRFEGRSDFLTWATRIVINAALQQIRRGRARPTIPLDNIENELDGHSFHEHLKDPTPTPEEKFQELEHAKLLKRAVQRLPAKRRQAIRICQTMDCSLKEAANTLGLSVGTLKARLHQGRRVLIAQLKRETQGQRKRALLDSANWTTLPRTDSYP